MAIALAARRFSERHNDYVAIMKSLGSTSAQVNRLYGGSLLLLGAFATAIGCMVQQMPRRRQLRTRLMLVIMVRFSYAGISRLLAPRMMQREPGFVRRFAGAGFRRTSRFVTILILLARFVTRAQLAVPGTLRLRWADH